MRCMRGAEINNFPNIETSFVGIWKGSEIDLCAQSTTFNRDPITHPVKYHKLCGKSLSFRTDLVWEMVKSLRDPWSDSLSYTRSP
jgi:hypothetical protein